MRSDVIVVGAGFAGLYALHRLRTLGFSVQVLEAEQDLGGTWYVNRYPGARCDIQSLAYGYTFDERLQHEWAWSERYAAQPEILAYLNFVAARLDLRTDITFGTAVAQAHFNDRANEWEVLTHGGARYSARYLLMAAGVLSASRLPDIPGLSDFKGPWYHTADWPRDGVDFSGKRVAIIGTGSSAVQAIPLIARQAQHLTVFQRTPGFVVPARNAPTPASETEQFRRQIATYRRRLRSGALEGIGDILLSDHLPATLPSARSLDPDQCRRLLQGRWDVGGGSIFATFADVLQDEATNHVVAEFCREKIRSVVNDPQVAARLTPTGYPFGSKRVCVGTDYYETFNRDDVALVDVSASPIVSFTKSGLRTRDQAYDFDTLVLATGFDAITGALTQIDIRGLNGASLREAWAHGPSAYLGLCMSGYPNLFTLLGPGSPSALGNVVMSIEQHVEWTTELLNSARQRGYDRVEVDAVAEREWTEHVREEANRTLFVKGKSWYTGANVPGKPRVFMAYVKGLGAYREICDSIARAGYRGFKFSSHGAHMSTALS